MEHLRSFYKFESKDEDWFWEIDWEKFNFWKSYVIDFDEDEIKSLQNKFPDAFYNEGAKLIHYSNSLFNIYFYKTKDNWYLIKAMHFGDDDNVWWEGDDVFDSYEGEYEYYQCDDLEGLIKFANWFYPA